MSLQTINKDVFILYKKNIFNFAIVAINYLHCILKSLFLSIHKYYCF